MDQNVHYKLVVCKTMWYKFVSQQSLVQNYDKVLEYVLKKFEVSGSSHWMESSLTMYKIAFRSKENLK